ncbi:hypothetical protein RIN58_18170 [Siccibacter colletis]|uniref:hypothetical protein n=1 Tax=Siccibacter colletis TaxID=1505757 RepID=UPI0028BE2F47|nr:hypothetical protein [Siccibacter colletis]WNN48266.1 hypothetical protein RIN58_18170 [Siccibacter colletis]
MQIQDSNLINRCFAGVWLLAERPVDNELPFQVRRRDDDSLRFQRADEDIFARSVPVSFKGKINS